MKKYFLDELAKYAEKKNPLNNVKLLGGNFYFTNNERLIHHICTANRSNYASGIGTEVSGEFNLGGMLNADQEFTDLLDKVITPAFKSVNLNDCFDIIVEETEHITKEWITEGRRESVINAELEFQRLALRTTVELFVSPQLEINVDPVLDALSDIMEVSDFTKHASNKRKRALSRLLPFITHADPRFEAAVEFVNALSNQLAEEYLRKNVDRGILFDKLFSLYSDDNTEYLIVISIIKRFLLVGFLPVAEALTWLFYSIDTTPGLRKKLEDEIELETEGKELTAVNVKKLKLLHSSILESLRMYPPIAVFQKSVTYRDEFEGTNIPQNSHILISPFILQRTSSVWKDANTFNPERFLDGKTPERGFIPFGDEVINTAAQELTIFEMQVVSALLLRKTRIYYQSKSAPVFKATPILSPVNRVLALAVKKANFESTDIESQENQ